MIYLNTKIESLGRKEVVSIANICLRWCRRNMGQRNSGWDFMWVSELLIIEIWDDKLKFMYEMWKN